MRRLAGRPENKGLQAASVSSCRHGTSHDARWSGSNRNENAAFIELMQIKVNWAGSS
jgi:hypothetical protein